MIATEGIEIVSQFCQAWANGDTDALLDYFTDDAVYHNIPIEAVRGKEAIRATITSFTQGVKAIEFRVEHISGSGDVVLTERVDVFTLEDKQVSLPVMGAFEIRDGRIAAWRDYFDLNQFMSQLAG